MSRGLLDTSVVIDLPEVLADGSAGLPEEAWVSTITVAELVQGPLFARDPRERARRQRRLQDVLVAFPTPLAFDLGCTAAYGPIVAATRAAGRSPRRRMTDLMIAATAAAHGLPLITRNSADVAHLRGLVDVRVV
jgi:predicted nucleic acid-binding protein